MSVVALIQAAARKEVEDPVVRKCLINLLNVLWKKLRGDPVQTEFFFLNADRLIVRKSEVVADSARQSRTRSRTTSSDYTLQSSIHQNQSEVAELILFTALLPHMYAIGKIGEKCREALVIAASVHERALCRFVLQLTPFCHYAVNGVIAAYDNLPKTLPDVATKSRGAGSSSSLASPTSRGGIEGEISDLAVRLRFCCTLSMVARFELVDVDENTGNEVRQSIADELLYQFRTRFLEGPLLEGLLNTSEAAARTATLYTRIVLEELTACGRDTRANPLLTEFVDFLLQRKPGTSSMVKSRSDGGGSTTDGNLVKEQQAPQREAEGLPVELLPTKLLHRMDSLSSSLSIATIDLFTYLLDLQDAYTDNMLLGPFDGADTKRDSRGGTSGGADTDSDGGATRKSLAPASNGAIWFASRFPESAVASNVHLWKIQAFVGNDSDMEIPAADDSEDQVLSLLSYIADAEYATCQRFPGTPDDTDESDGDSDRNGDDEEAWGAEQAATSSQAVVSPSSKSRKSTSGTRAVSPRVSRTAATRNAVKPLKEVYLSLTLPSFSPVVPPEVQQERFSSVIGLQQIPTGEDQATASATDAADEVPLFLRIVFNRAERILENSFHENLALSGLLCALAQKSRCMPVVFDLNESRPSGLSLRSILEDVYNDALRRVNRLSNGYDMVEELRKKLIEDDNDATLNDHEAESRLLCGYVVLEEMLKELCSLLFARERVKALPLKPEGYYLEPKRSSTSLPRAISSETLYSDAGSTGPFSPVGGNGSDEAAGEAASQPANISKEFEAMLAEAESSMESLLVSTAGSQSDNSAEEAEAVASSE